MEAIETIRAKTAEEFIVELSPGQQAWCQTGGQTCWVFRGQKDASWGLTPSVMRPKGLMVYGIGVATELTPATAAERRRREQQQVLGFAGECVDCNLPLPEDSQWFRNDRLSQIAFGRDIGESIDGGIDFPFPLFRSLYALAQHYGVPTRLLDWTQTALVAAYFAAYELARWYAANPGTRAPGCISDELCVWALRSAIIRDELNDSEPTIDLVDAPYAHNPNLRAQRGLFTLVKYRTDAGKDDHYPPDLDALVLTHQQQRFQPGESNGNWPLLRKVVLPHDQARALLRRLHDANVNSGTIYPSYGCVAQSISDREFWV